MHSWIAAIVQNDTGDRFAFMLKLENGEEVTLWADKTHDEAVELVFEFQKLNAIPLQQAPSLIYIAELM